MEPESGMHNTPGRAKGGALGQPTDGALEELGPTLGVAGEKEAGGGTRSESKAGAEDSG